MLILNAEMEKALRSQERNKGETEKHRASELASPTANSSSGHESVSKVTGWSTASALFLQKECLTLNRRYPGTRERELAGMRSEKRLGLPSGLGPRRKLRTQVTRAEAAVQVAWLPQTNGRNVGK